MVTIRYEMRQAVTGYFVLVLVQSLNMVHSSYKQGRDWYHVGAMSLITARRLWWFSICLTYGAHLRFI
ncbi:unnamed protein product [Adineta ricciae]|uniref:Uncharacterized protein n=1 Tax=Adineta ricciae TaxID=249248 RepID=A0A814W4H2_ADIRI|nr:unnamed protein product [Adineta ricciae]